MQAKSEYDFTRLLMRGCESSWGAWWTRQVVGYALVVVGYALVVVGYALA
jgi:hypothetical protein